METLKILKENFGKGAFLVTVFEHCEKTERKRKLRKAVKMMKGKDLRYIYYRIKKSPQFVCGEIVVDKYPDVLWMNKRGVRCGIMWVPEKNFPALAKMIDEGTNGKYSLSPNLTVSYC